MAKEKAKSEPEAEAATEPTREEVLLNYAKKFAKGQASEGDAQAVRRVGEALLAEEKAKG